MNIRTFQAQKAEHRFNPVMIWNRSNSNALGTKKKPFQRSAETASPFLKFLLSYNSLLNCSIVRFYFK